MIHVVSISCLLILSKVIHLWGLICNWGGLSLDPLHVCLHTSNLGVQFSRRICHLCLLSPQLQQVVLHLGELYVGFFTAGQKTATTVKVWSVWSLDRRGR